MENDIIKHNDVMNWKKMHKVLRIVWVLAGLAFTAWLVLSFQAQGFDIAAVTTSSEKISITDSDQILSFIPTSGNKDIGIIFYPGAMVDPEAYAPLARSIAEEGYSVYIFKLPWRLAPFESHVAQLFERTSTFIQEKSNTTWIIAGHSKGGALATRFVKEHPGATLGGLALIGTSHPKDTSTSLTGDTLPIIKVSASLDGLASKEEVDENKQFLPLHTEYYEIQGGNHSQFGYYGFQLGDHRATISRESQQKEMRDVLIQFLQKN